MPDAEGEPLGARPKDAARQEALAARLRKIDLKYARLRLGALLVRQALSVACVVSGTKLTLLMLEQPYPMVEASGVGLTLGYALCYLQRTAFCVPAVWTAILGQELWDETFELMAGFERFRQARRNMKG